ncbi:hypothetical protein CBFG_01575 [Clostridiales bacterium 1_7_47FAA]|nr:hypothetical protein CBFG_01575 [Clostridiales bacterium 1_7_47FAA]
MLNLQGFVDIFLKFKGLKANALFGLFIGQNKEKKLGYFTISVHDVFSMIRG